VDAAPAKDPAAPALGASPAARPWADAWKLSLALGLATLMVACGLALAFGWVRLERAMDVRALFR
jgi:hypothetical protein